MTKPGDSDEWWKQYGGEGVSADSGAQPSTPQYPTSEPSGYPSAPQYQQPPAQPYQSAPQQFPQAPGPAYPSPPGYQPYGYAPAPSQTNGLAIGALVSSLVGFCSCGIGSLVGIVLGVMALNQLKENPYQDGRGMAQSSIWVGVAGIVVTILYWTLVIFSEN
ncbi:DUF4190 domain-containing protein [Nocardia sp. XZ_19_385]|uniref:DUF4190 domain-containing protein n=1 Tax=Nocardia sp. XZ_19_385 TaxID=2769488 RepID=UPI0018902953|nr:DUF4190 domain-containing protein [Nocardia sp. XZ_19_385]